MKLFPLNFPLSNYQPTYGNKIYSLLCFKESKKQPNFCSRFHADGPATVRQMRVRHRVVWAFYSPASSFQVILALRCRYLYRADENDTIRSLCSKKKFSSYFKDIPVRYVIFFDFRRFKMNHNFIADRVDHRFLLGFSGFRVVKDEAVCTPSVIYLFCH
jgi:hypothetical protein